MKRTGAGSPPRPVLLPMPMPAQDADDTESYEDSSEDTCADPAEQARIAQAARMQQALAVAQDLSQPSAQREEAVNRCVDSLPAGQFGAGLCLDATHWQLFEAITWLDAPQDGAERFAARYLTQPEAPLMSARCLDCVHQVKAARNAIASLALGNSFIGCSTAAKAVLEMVKSLGGLSVATYKLIDIAFRGHPDLVPDVHAALCKLIKEERGVSMDMSMKDRIGMLASLHSCLGGDQLDFQSSVEAMSPPSETGAGIIISALRLCQALTSLVQSVHKEGLVNIDAERAVFLETKEALSGLCEATPDEGHDDKLLTEIYAIWRWTESILCCIPPAAAAFT